MIRFPNAFRPLGRSLAASRGLNRSKNFYSRKSCVRKFSGNPKVTVHDPTPPPPPPKSGSGTALFILVGAVTAAGIYYSEEITEKLGIGKNLDEKPTVVKKLEEAKETAQILTQEAAGEVKREVTKAEAALTEADPKPSSATRESSEKVDWNAVREEIVELLEPDEGKEYDDGSYGPIFVRLAWHHAGTFDKNTGLGGSEGAAMRFGGEGNWGANAGLHIARARLERVKAKFPDATYSDLWSYAGTVAIEEMGGPPVTKMWRPGRSDVAKAEDNILPDGLLPDADGRETPAEPQTHVRNIFYRMGFNDREIVALSGAHALGRCHENASGYWGPWTNAPTTFSNEYFRLLLEEKWSKKKTHKGKEWTGPEQYETSNGELMMLPTDMSLVWDTKFKPVVEEYAKDEDKFFDDFGKAWIKLQELGVKRFHGWRKYYLFGQRG